MLSDSDYSSQLKGWATDRVIELFKANSPLGATPKSVDDIIADARKLAEFCYSPEEDLQNLAKRYEELSHDVERAKAIAMKPASNRADYSTEVTDKVKAVQ